MSGFIVRLRSLRGTGAVCWLERNATPTDHELWAWRFDSAFEALTAFVVFEETLIKHVGHCRWECEIVEVAR